MGRRRGELVTDVDLERDRIADAIERGTLAKVIKGELDAILLAHKTHVTAAASTRRSARGSNGP